MQLKGTIKVEEFSSGLDEDDLVFEATVTGSSGAEQVGGAEVSFPVVGCAGGCKGRKRREVHMGWSSGEGVGLSIHASMLPSA